MPDVKILIWGNSLILPILFLFWSCEAYFVFLLKIHMLTTLCMLQWGTFKLLLKKSIVSLNIQ